MLGLQRTGEVGRKGSFDVSIRVVVRCYLGWARDLRAGAVILGLHLVLESPVQSGFLAQKNKTETETGPDVS